MKSIAMFLTCSSVVSALVIGTAITSAGPNAALASPVAPNQVPVTSPDVAKVEPVSPKAVEPARPARTALHHVKQTRFDSALWINTTVDVSTDGQLDGRIRVWSKHFFVGFTGTALVILRDAGGNILYRAKAPSSGVNGECWGRSDVTKTWTTSLPAVVREHVAAIEVVNYKSPQKLGDLAKQNIDSVRDAMARYAK